MNDAILSNGTIVLNALSEAFITRRIEIDVGAMKERFVHVGNDTRSVFDVMSLLKPRMILALVSFGR